MSHSSSHGSTGLCMKNFACMILRQNYDPLMYILFKPASNLNLSWMECGTETYRDVRMDQ
jgi:hypothetical protein